MRSLTLAASLVAASAFAQIYEARGSLGLSLERSVLTASNEADVVVTDRVVTAQHGVRLEAGGQGFTSSTAVSLDVPYRVRDGRGAEHRVWIRTLAGERLVVEVQHLRARDGVPAGAPNGRFRASSVTVDGATAQPTFGDLRLEQNGKYRMGSASGRWAYRNGQLHFEGAIAHWGVAAPAQDGDGVIFQFDRGPATWVVRFDKVVEPAEAEAIAAR